MATPDGLVPITSLEVGDWVLAYDEDTQELGAYPVEATWSHEASQLVYLTVDGEVIKATANHPVYALGRGWVDAGALMLGDRLIEADGELGVVQALSVAGERAVVYNLTVTDAHTYFVGGGQWWVHNCSSEVPVDVYAFGNTTAPRPPREGRDLIPDGAGMVGPEQPPLPQGASTFGDVSQAPLNGAYHRLPAGAQLPDGMRIVADGADVVPGSPHPATHHTIYPARQMRFDDFVTQFRNLPWQYVGRK